MSGTTPGRALRAAIIAVPLVAAAALLWARWPGTEPAPVDVSSNGPTFATLADLAAASDLVVVGEIDGESTGRSITDPVEPDAGIRTTLYSLRVETVVAGRAGENAVQDPSASPVITLENETALLDGTPITIDGIGPPRPGERGLYFLVAGDSEAFPHHAVIGSQGRFPLDGDSLLALGDDPLSRSLDGRTLADVTAAIRAP